MLWFSWALPADQLDYEVIEKGSAGFLGIGVKQAVIKARKKVEEPVVPAKEESLERRAEESETSVVKEGKKILLTGTRIQTGLQKRRSIKINLKKEEKPAEVKEEKKEIELGKVEDQTMDACVTFVADCDAGYGYGRCKSDFLRR